MFFVVVLLVLSAYALISTVFLCFPALLHGRVQRSGPKLHCSHRGGSAERVENTLSAFRHAMCEGTEMLELDVHLTRDLQVVVNHDADLSRQCGIKAQVSSFDYAQLPRYLPPSELALPPEYHPPGSVLSDQPEGATAAAERDAGRMPLLEEVLSEFSELWINIDIKAKPEHGAAELTRRTHDLLVKHGRQARTVWGSSAESKNLACYAIDPSIPLIFSTAGVLRLLALFYSGLLPMVPLRESFLEVPLLTDADLAWDVSLRPRWAYAALGWLVRSRVLFWHLRRRGVATWAWVYNTDEAYDQAFALGVDGVMTDRPSHLRRYLDRRAAGSGGGLPSELL